MTDSRFEMQFDATTEQQISWWTAYRNALDSIASAAFFAGGDNGDYKNANERLADACEEIKTALALFHKPPAEDAQPALPRIGESCADYRLTPEAISAIEACVSSADQGALK